MIKAALFLLLLISGNAFGAIYNAGFGMNGAWYNPDFNGQGANVNLIQRANGTQEIMLNFFTFDQSGNKQAWIYSSGPLNGRVAQLTPVAVTGGRFNSSQVVSKNSSIGSITAELTDCEHLTVTWNLNAPQLGIVDSGSSQMIRLTPQVTHNGKYLCSEELLTTPIPHNPTKSVGAGLGLDGAWYNPQTDGQGVNVSYIQRADGKEEILMNMFTYDNNGTKQSWVYSSGPLVGRVAQLTPIAVTGGKFNNAKAVSMNSNIGNITVELVDCETMDISWSLNAQTIGINNTGSARYKRLTPELHSGGSYICSGRPFVLDTTPKGIRCEGNQSFAGEYQNIEALRLRVSQVASSSCVKIDNYLVNWGFAPCDTSCSFINGYLPADYVAPPSCSGTKPSDETVTEACSGGQTGQLTKRRIYTCEGTTWTAGAWSVIASTCATPTPTPTPTPAPLPPPPATCPAPPSGMISATLAGMGNPLRHAQYSGQITSIPVPRIAEKSIKIILSETTSVASPQPVTIEAAVSKCPGYVYTDTNDHCTLRSYNGNYNAITMITKPYNIITNKETANRYGYCWAPESEGQWYFSTRWYYEACGFGQVTCGFAIQYNMGPFN